MNGTKIRTIKLEFQLGLNSLQQPNSTLYPFTCLVAQNLPFVSGSAIAASDILVFSQVEGFKARLARYLFVMPPFVAMPVSYVATR